MTVGELITVLRDIPGNVEVRVTDDSGEFEWNTIDAGLVLFADPPPVAYIAEGVLCDGLPDEARTTLGRPASLDPPGWRAE